MNLQKAIIILQSNQVSPKKDNLILNLDCRALILTTFLYLIIVLSLPLYKLDQIIWFAIFPIVMAPLTGESYSKIFVKSLYVLPFILLIGIFNPFIDKSEAFKVGDWSISYGWLSFFSIIIRGLLCMQALLILINFSGFLKICDAFRSLRAPKILTVQLLLLYRYLWTLLEESQRMHNAIVSRGYGKNSYSIKLWTQFVGGLFINTIERSKRIHRAMIARGFNGEIHVSDFKSWRPIDTFFLLICLSLFAILYFVNISELFFSTI